MVTVCQTCGDIGFEEALVYCDSCKTAAKHRYCLGITPTPFTECITWICEDCDACDCHCDSISRFDITPTVEPNEIAEVVDGY